jgi:hypothetical protein
VTRLSERLEELFAIGGGPGANRIGSSAEEDAAHELAADWMRAAGLDVEVDAHGNLLGRLPGDERELPEVWTGSHLDSVPRGGRYDGALGVVAGIEALERLGRRRRTLAVVAFRDEERGCVGSRARCRAGDVPGAWVELHHEQGPRLAQACAPLGVVTGIVGYKRGTRELVGRAGHAGTTPMEGRTDALVAAAGEILRIRDVATAIDGAVATVGTLEVEPGGANVVPGRSAQHFDQKAGIECDHQVFAVVTAFHSFITLERKINILRFQFQLTACNIQRHLVGAFIAEYIHTAQSPLEIIFIYDKFIWIVCRDHNFIIGKAGIDQAATHLCSAMLYKKMIAVVAQCYFIFIGWNS